MIDRGIPMKMQTTEWFVPNFGIVKSETYKRVRNWVENFLQNLKIIPDGLRIP